jgi:hypothetical protein
VTKEHHLKALTPLARRTRAVLARAMVDLRGFVS